MDYNQETAKGERIILKKLKSTTKEGGDLNKKKGHLGNSFMGSKISIRV